MLAAPMLSHALMTGRERRRPAAVPGLPGPVLLVRLPVRARGLFGNLGQPAGAALSCWFSPSAWSCWFSASLPAGPARRSSTCGLAGSPLELLLLAGAGPAPMMLSFAFMAYERRMGLWPRPAAVVLGDHRHPPADRGRCGRPWPAFAPALDGFVERASSARGLAGLLALAPTALLFVVSFKLSLTAPRAFLIFVPLPFGAGRRRGSNGCGGSVAC